MSKRTKADVDCSRIEEFVDEGPVPAHLSPHHGEVVRPDVVAQYVDQWDRESDREFKVLFDNGSVATVRGHQLKLLQNSTNPEDFGSYAVILRSAGQETIVALFRVNAVAGVFCGDLQLSGD